MANNTFIERVEIYAYDETHVQIVTSDRGLLQNISEYFTYDVKNASFHPKVKAKLWDGKIRLLNRNNDTIYKGLVSYIVKFCEDRDYECIVHDEVFSDKEVVSDEELDDFIASLNLKYEPYDFQIEAFKHCVKDLRATLISPTSSGKSLIIYMLLRWYITRVDKKMLITVPTIDLVNQLMDEFVDYDTTYDIKSHIHKIFAGQEKISDKKIIISTWQSVYTQRAKYFDLFDFILADEAHQAQADSIKGIFERARNTKYRFGLTGTLDDLQYHRLIIEGLTGPVKTVAKTKTLMDRNIVSKLKVNALVMKYDEQTRKDNKKFKFQEEMSFICKCAKRTTAIAKLANVIPKKKNMLVLTAYVEHAKTLAEEIEKQTGKTVYIVHGKTETEERERIRKLAEVSEDIVIVATYGVYSTGINIKNLQYILFATGSKSMIRLLQSIGRGLRLDGKSNTVIVIDIVDDFSHNNKKNYLLRHFFDRIKIYVKQQFEYQIKVINI